MNQKQDKKIILLLILKILEKTDEQYPITQEEIADLIFQGSKSVLKKELSCNRKTVGRNVRVLKEAGYKIISLKKKGMYMENKKLTFSERLIIKKLLNDSDIDDADKESIINKLS